MSRTITPEFWRIELMGHTIRKIQARGIDMPDVEVDLMFRSGMRYRIVPTEGAKITACTINITRHALPISNVISVWRGTTFEVHIFAARNQLICSVYGDGTDDGKDYPFVLKVVPS